MAEYMTVKAKSELASGERSIHDARRDGADAPPFVILDLVSERSGWRVSGIHASAVDTAQEDRRIPAFHHDVAIIETWIPGTLA